LPELAFFDAFVFSARIGVAKPAPAAFLAALDVMGVPPGEVVFIDDREPNVAGARAVGIDGRRFSDAGALRAELLG
jgi:HAD superfamily hydrolase (TIGR01509 family)